MFANAVIAAIEKGHTDLGEKHRAERTVVFPMTTQ
jgi:hypothetical protein